MKHVHVSFRFWMCVSCSLCPSVALCCLVFVSCLCLQLHIYILCGPPYVKIGGAHPKIIKKNESDGAVVRNRFKIIFTKTLKPCKIIFLKSTHPPKIIFNKLTTNYLVVVPPVLSKQLQPP